MTVMMAPRAVPVVPIGLLDNRKRRASTMRRISGRGCVRLAHWREHCCSEHGAYTKYRFHLDDSRLSRACLTLFPNVWTIAFVAQASRAARDIALGQFGSIKRDEGLPATSGHSAPAPGLGIFRT